MNLLDWSKNNLISVALNKQVYLWNAASGDIQELMECEGEENYISSVQFTKDGSHLAIGLNTGCVEIWDVAQQRKMRTMAGHSARVGSLAWNEHVLSSGSRTGLIFHHDVRLPQHHVSTLEGHTQEVPILPHPHINWMFQVRLRTAFSRTLENGMAIRCD